MVLKYNKFEINYWCFIIRKLNDRHNRPFFHTLSCIHIHKGSNINYKICAFQTPNQYGHFDNSTNTYKRISYGQ